MNICNIFKSHDVNNLVDEYRKTPGSVLLDVRTTEEYERGRIPGSVNIPLSDIDTVSEFITNKSTPVFVYCLSGARSSAAVNQLKKYGFEYVVNIGGISRYKGKLEV